MKVSALPLVALASLSLLSHVNAATISFSAPQNLSADTEVSNNGSLVYAYSLSNITTSLDGVTFTGASNTSNLGSGNITMTGFDGANTTAFVTASGLSATYRQLLQGSIFTGTAALATVSLNNLTIGQTYEVQVWVQDPRAGATATRTEVIRNIDDSGSITLDYNSTNAGGGVGQFTIGTFTADGTSQSFEMLGNASTQMNAIQLRLVPEPSQLALLGLAGIALTLRRRR